MSSSYTRHLQPSGWAISINSILVLPTVLLNDLVIFAVVTRERLRNTSTILLACLAAAGVRRTEWKVPIQPATYVVSCFKQSSERLLEHSKKAFLSPNELTLVKWNKIIHYSTKVGQPPPQKRRRSPASAIYAIPLFTVGAWRNVARHFLEILHVRNPENNQP